MIHHLLSKTSHTTITSGITGTCIHLYLPVYTCIYLYIIHTPCYRCGQLCIYTYTDAWQICLYICYHQPVLNPSLFDTINRVFDVRVDCIPAYVSEE